MSESTDALVQRLRVLLANAEVAGPVPEALIASAEETLGLAFPWSYRAFLATFGAALLHGRHVAGIDPNYTDPNVCPYFSDVVSDTLSTRRVSRGHIPSTLLPISDDGMDDTFYLDTAAVANGDCPVIVLGPGRDGDQVAEGLVGFIALLASEQI